MIYFVAENQAAGRNLPAVFCYFRDQTFGVCGELTFEVDAQESEATLDIRSTVCLLNIL